MGALGERVVIEVPGARLDGQLHRKAVPGGGGAGLLVLHPYPLLGGSMADPVVTEVFRAAIASPAFAAVLRYNQRGVGRSSGSRSVRCRADLDDVAAACAYLRDQLPLGPERRICVVGYSWGACLATRALSGPGLAASASISFPLGGLAALLGPRHHLELLCAATHVPRLLAVGSQDQYVKQATLQQLVEQHGGTTYPQWAAGQQEQQQHQGGGAPVSGAAAGAAASPAQHASPAPLVLRVYQGEDHFWMGGEGPHMAQDVVRWLEGAVGAGSAAVP